MASIIKCSLQGMKKTAQMGHALGEERSSVQPTTSNTVRGKGSSSFGQPYLDQKSCPEKVVNSKTKENERKSRIQSKTRNDDDELIKHMSNLAGFLRRVEKENSIQEKALNFGVLDWKRLEKWRYNERMPSKYPKKSSSSSSNSYLPTNLPPKMVPNLRKQPSYHGLNPSSLSSGKLPHDSSRFFSPQRQQAPSHQSSHLNPVKEEKTVVNQKEVKDVEGMKLKGKETCNQVFQAAKSRSFDKQQNNFHQRVESYERSCSKANMDNNNKKDSKKELLSKKEPSSSELAKPKIDLYSTDKTSSVRKENESTYSEEVNFDRNILSECRKELISEKDPSSSDQHKNTVNSLGKRSQTRFTEEVNFTSDCCASDPQNNMSLPKNFSRSCSGNSQFTESRTSIDGQLSEAIIVSRFSDCFSPLELYSGEFSADIPHSCPLPYVGPVQAQSATEPIERGTINEKSSTVKGRAPSPTRRFSFNLRRMSRSFSFKEGSAIPQLSSQYTSVKSGPVRPEISFNTENSEKDKGNSSGNGRSSPFRRLLDPLLKSKPVEIVRSKDWKLEGSTFHALLQLTLKNELPFFKLVVDNSSDVLAAAAKRSEKRDSCLNYAFYSIHEVKKKSMNWISQGSKSKSSVLSCKTIGQMNISSSNYSNEYARECVLYGVDMQTPECVVANKEITAIVVKKSIQEKSDEEETRKCNGMVVLPGGVHGTPIKGAPSSLLSRWRSGGSCDCGGWDVGCKLQILCDDQQNNNVSRAPVDQVNLFAQGREQKSKPVLSLERLNNGFYSVELDTSISLLEAFATCVACVTCRDFSEILDSNDTTASYVEYVVGTDKKKTPTTFGAQIPAKYVTCPPLSPAGRI